MDNAVERRKRHLSEGDESTGQQDARRVRSLIEVPDHNMAPHRLAGRPSPNGQHENPFVKERNQINRPPSPPESEQDEDEGDDDESEDDDATLAGYEYCSKEAIRYLMEEEKLDADHPVVRQLQQHLTSRRIHIPSNPGPSSNQE